MSQYETKRREIQLEQYRSLEHSIILLERFVESATFNGRNFPIPGEADTVLEKLKELYKLHTGVEYGYTPPVVNEEVDDDTKGRAGVVEHD